jgi:hypothetical protein
MGGRKQESKKPTGNFSQNHRKLFSDPSQRVNRYILVAQQEPEILRKNPTSLCTTLKIHEEGEPWNRKG